MSWLTGQLSASAQLPKRYGCDVACIVDNAINDSSCICKAIRKAEEIYYQSDKTKVQNI